MSKKAANVVPDLAKGKFHTTLGLPPEAPGKVFRLWSLLRVLCPD